MINFPSSPTTNQSFSSGALSWVWDGAKWTAATATTTATAVLHPGFIAGRYYTTEHTGETAGATLTANRIYAVPFWCPVATTFTKIGIYVQTLVSASTANLGIYADAAGLPAGLVGTAGTVPTTTTGYKELTGLTLILPAAFYWLAVQVNAAPGLRAAAVTDYIAWNTYGGGNPGTSAAANSGVGSTGAAFVSGTLPSTFPGPVIAAGAIPFVYLGL